MDKIPSGVPPGADGAFERFLTAALATIITIMFSWRLLAEEEEAAGRQLHGTSGPARTTIPYQSSRPSIPAGNHGTNVDTSNVPAPSLSKMPSAPRFSDRNIDENKASASDTNRSISVDPEEVQEAVFSAHFEPSYARKSESEPIGDSLINESISFSDDDDNSETLTTWDEYKWEEELGEEDGEVIKTNRSVRDFVKQKVGTVPSVHVSDEGHDDSQTSAHHSETSGLRTHDDADHKPATTSTGSPSLTFAQRFANFEYKDCSGDSGYIDLYPDVDSDDNTDSSDDEHIYEIQVSDSDSDSGDDRGGVTFFGVTALDTIMEEIESDVGDDDEGVVEKKRDLLGRIDNDENVEIVSHSAELDNFVSSQVGRDEHGLNHHSLHVSEAKVLEINQPELNIVPEWVENSYDCLRTSIHDKTDSDRTEQAVSNFCERTEGEHSQSAVLPSHTPSTTNDSFNRPKPSTHHGVGGSGKECDLTVDNIHSVLVGNSDGKHEHDSGYVMGDMDILRKNARGSESQTLEMSPAVSSDITAASGPQSPIRTIALDNFADDQMSDTDSCAESVITVLSMRSTDSDNYTLDQYDCTTAAVNPAVSQSDSAPGQTDQLLLINDRYSNYEHSSLVSGFLNDSLNSLLSNKTTESEHSHSDVDIDPALSLIKHDGASTDSDTHLEEPREFQRNYMTQSENIQNGSLKDSSSESLGQINAPHGIDNISDINIPMNGHDSHVHNSYFNPPGGQNQFATDRDVIGDYVDSSDSDSSDPPLREYDPDDDDLAAFQFSHDGDDDSFYLLVGDEGSLRNFETFTNLNSVGLNEYSDAVASHTQFEDARGFTFSRTEEIDTQFRKRAYFTDRNTSDSDAHSDSVLSPINSEDEEIKPTETDNVTNLTTKYDQLYNDAEVSTASQDLESAQRDHIDFHKYIIPSQKDSTVETNADIGIEDHKLVIKHREQIDTDTNISDQCEQIDDEAINCDTVGASAINNEESSQISTAISLPVGSSVEKQESGSSPTCADIGLDTRAHIQDKNVVNKQSKDAFKIETNIDDIFEENDLKAPQGNINNFDQSRPVQSETIEASNVTRVRSSPTKSKLETNIDDLFTEDVSSARDFSSTPEVNLDAHEEISEVKTHQSDTASARKRQNKRNATIETCIDDYDLFSSQESSTQTKPVTVDSKLSYETFVDDLFENVVDTDASPPNCVLGAVTSENGGENKSDRYVVEDSVVQERAVRVCSVSPEHTPSTVGTPPNDKWTEKEQITYDAKQLNTPVHTTYSKDEPANEQLLFTNNKSSSEQSPTIINIPLESEIINNPDEHTAVEDSVKECKQLPKSDYNGNVSVPKVKNLKTAVNNEYYSGTIPDGNKWVHTEEQDTALDGSLRQNNNLSATVDILDYVSRDLQQIELRIVEEGEEDIDENNVPIKADSQLDSLETSSIGSCSITSDDESLNSIGESYNVLHNTYNETRKRGLSDSSLGRVVRAPNTKPSDVFVHKRQKDLKGVKKKVHQHQLKKYTSILQSPVTPERVHVGVTAPELRTPLSRLKAHHSRQRFLSAENLSDSSFEEKFLQHRTSLVSSTPKKYIKRRDKHNNPDTQSTESLPNMFSYLQSGYGSNTSMDRMHSLPSPRNIDELYASRPTSTNTSFEKPDFHKLHENCIFSPEKRAEITHTTQSLENMFEQLLRYGSVSSMAETDIDAVDEDDQHNTSFHDSFMSDYVSFQYPLERAASMSALTATSDGHRLPRKPGKGRFARRNVPKSKSLQTLETNLDDVFADEAELSGGLKKVPSVHELRVSKSLTKLAVPDWFKKSSFSRSDSTQSLFTYARQGSTSTLGSCAYPSSITSSPSVTPNRGTVIIQKRVTPSAASPSARLVRAPLLPATPEKSPIHTPYATLPSDKFRKDPKKELKPIPIVPFAKIREMFERKAQQDATARKSSISSPTKDGPPSSLKLNPSGSPMKEPVPILKSPSRETAIDACVSEPVQSERPVSPSSALDRKPCIVPESARRSGSELQKSGSGRRMQVHFSDEKDVSNPVDKNSNSNSNSNSESLRQNGTNSVQPDKRASSSGKSTTSKAQSLRAALPKPQFRFRRPGIFATKAATQQAAQSTNTQSKKETTV